MQDKAKFVKYLVIDPPLFLRLLNGDLPICRHIVYVRTKCMYGDLPTYLPTYLLCFVLG